MSAEAGSAGGSGHMNSTRSLTFLWVPWSLAVSVLVVLATAVFCFIAWRRSGYRRGLGFLELCRLGLVCIAAVLFNQPEWIQEFRPDEKPSVAVLWDASASMDTRDVLGSAGDKSANSDRDPPRSHRPIRRTQLLEARFPNG